MLRIVFVLYFYSSLVLGADCLLALSIKAPMIEDAQRVDGLRSLKTHNAELHPAAGGHVVGAVARTLCYLHIGERGRTLRLGVPPAWGSLCLMPPLPSFFASHPDVAVEFLFRIPAQQHYGLGNLHAVITFVGTPGADAEMGEVYRTAVAACRNNPHRRSVPRSERCWPP